MTLSSVLIHLLKYSSRFLYLFLVVLLFSCDNPEEFAQKPNIIYILADDLGYGELGAYGQQKIQTPNLDRMAAQGMRFTQHYTGAPVCAPSRYMFLTGTHAGHAYIRGNYELGQFEDDKEGGQMHIPETTPTLAKMLKSVGYQTAMIGKWGLGMNGTTGSPLLQGFDYYYGYLDQKQAHNYYPTHLWENDQWDSLSNNYVLVHQPLKENPSKANFDQFKGQEYAPDKMLEKAIEFIDTTATESPFFLYYPSPIPHVSLQVPDSLVQKYQGKFEETPYLGDKGYSGHQYPLSAYAAMISHLDDEVGKIWEALKTKGVEDNTIILFSSDNGPTFNGGVDAKFFNSAAGLRGLKMDVYEGGIRIPLIAYWPDKIPAGKVSDLISGHLDMHATFAEIAGVQGVKSDGISILPELLGKKQTATHPYLYFEYPEKRGQIAIRMGDWKGVKRDLKTKKNVAWELYDLKNDRSEQTDLSSQYPDKIQQLDAILKEAHSPSHIREWEFINPKFKRR